MARTASSPRSPSARSTANDQESFELDTTLLSLASETNKGGVRNLRWDYNSGVVPQVDLTVFQNTTVKAGSLRQEIGLEGVLVHARRQVP
jgi:hypothetical protein